MAGKPKLDSAASTARRLSEKLGFAVTRKMVQLWTKKGYPLSNVAELKRKLRNQERLPAPLKVTKKAARKTAKRNPKPSPPKPPPLQADQVEKELAELQKELLKAEDYDEARTINTKITGVRGVLKELREQKHYIRISESIAHASMAAVASKAAWEGIEDELPPQLEGLTAAQMKEKLRAFARGKALELSEIFHHPA